MSKHNIQFHDELKEIPIYLFSWAIGRICRDSKNQFKLAIVNEPSVFELLRFHCTTFTLIFLTQLSMCYPWKGPFCNWWTMQPLISLRISTGWSGPVLSAYRIRGYCSICWRTENAQNRLHRCACWSRSTLYANYIRALFMHYASNFNTSLFTVLLTSFRKSFFAQGFKQKK